MLQFPKIFVIFAIIENFVPIVCQLSSSSLSTASSCPFTCVCKWKNGKQTVDCLNRGLLHIPSGIDPGTQVLIYSQNNVSNLGPKLFEQLQLINLQKIYLAKCNVTKIDSSAMQGLKNLVELDLSGNRLKSVPNSIFSDIPLLMKLDLSENPLKSVRSFAFQSLRSLVQLDLSECQLELIELESFSGLENLETLKLNDNRLKTIPGVKTLPSQLLSIDLNNNNWLCDCNLEDFQQWLAIFKVQQSLDPKCQHPFHLKNHEIRTIAKQDLACLPEITRSANFIEIDEGKNISLSCKIFAKPNAKISWWFQGRRLQSNELDDQLDLTYSMNDEEVAANEYLSELNVYQLRASVANRTFGCEAENGAGKTHMNFTVHVFRNDHEDPTVVIVTFPYESLIAAIVAGILLVLVCLLILICAFLKCFRRRKRRQNGGSDLNCGSGCGGCDSVGQNCCKASSSVRSQSGSTASNHLLRSNSSIKCATLTPNYDSDIIMKCDSPELQIQEMLANNTESINLQRFERETFSPRKSSLLMTAGTGTGIGTGTPQTTYESTEITRGQRPNPDLLNDTSEIAYNSLVMANVSASSSASPPSAGNMVIVTATAAAATSNSSNNGPTLQIQSAPNCDFYTRTSTYFLDGDGYPIDYGLPKPQTITVYPPMSTTSSACQTSASGCDSMIIAQNGHFYRTLPYKRKIPNGGILKKQQSRDMEFYDYDVGGTKPVAPYCSTNVRYTVNGYPEYDNSDNSISRHGYNQNNQFFGHLIHNHSSGAALHMANPNTDIYQHQAQYKKLANTNDCDSMCSIQCCNNNGKPITSQQRTNPKLYQVYHHCPIHHCHDHHHQQQQQQQKQQQHQPLPSILNHNVLMLNGGSVISNSPDEGYVGDSTEI